MDITSLPMRTDRTVTCATPGPHIPPPDKRMLGRSEELARVAELLQECRFVTIVGPGGMGKTTVARALAQDYAELYPDGVRFIDLAVLAEGRELVGALGAALGIARLTRDGLAQLATCLRGQRMLIVFDCCEHHAGVAAQACEALLRAAPGIDVLCTSREPLLAHSERIVRLGPIGLPDVLQAADAEAALRVPAVELFLARARIADPARFLGDSRTRALVCDVCRAAEGLPLALELAAALVRPLGLERLARQTSRCLLASYGQPHMVDRHRTLSSMLDWSYDALSRTEQRVLRCLAVFRGGFTLEAAGAVAAGAGLDADLAIDIVIELAGKSLVSTNGAAGTAVRPRLLDVTREYAYDKLVQSGELDEVQRRHAGWLVALTEALDRDWMALSRSAWVERYGPWIDDILAAIAWSLGPGAEPLLAGRLAAAGFSVGDQLGYSREFQDCVHAALDAVGKLQDPPPAILLRLMTVACGGRDLSGHPFIQLMADFERCMQLARQAGLPQLQGGPLISLWGWPYVRGDYPPSLAGAERMAGAARDSADPSLELIGERTMAQSLHFMGRHVEARRFAGLTLAHSHRRIPLSCLPSPMDVGTSIRITIARMLWMEGAADQAVAMSEEALHLSESDRPVAMCHVLAMASVPVALWRGETARAAQLTRRLRERAERHGMGYWADWARCFEEGLDVIEGRADAQSRAFFTDTQGFSAKCRDHLVTFSPGLLTDDAIARVAAGTVGWCAPELQRARALRRLSRDALDGDGGAAVLLRLSLATAREQGAPGWTLRSATTLAALYLRQDAHAQARATLEPVLARCREGQGTADMRAALAVMAALG